jgi:hypothetical protein
MTTKTALVFVLCFLASSLARAADNNDGLLLIEVKVKSVGDLNVTVWDPNDAGAHSFRLKNLKSGKAYGVLTIDSDMKMMEVPAGIYCLASITFGGGSTQLYYCGEPFFKVEAGRVNNAGRWRFLYHYRDMKGRLFSATEDMDGLLADAKKRYPEKFQSKK